MAEEDFAAQHSHNSKALAKFSRYIQVEVEPVGQAFWAIYMQRESDCVNATSDSKKAAVNGIIENGENEEDEINDIEISVDTEFLHSLNPKEWKQQDHYRVLGLGNLRNAASDGLLKKAYRKMVLIHHPDKRYSRGEKVCDVEKDYFTCITKAYEILGNPTKRMSYDSVDPEFDDSIPSANAHSKANFYKVFSKAFKRNGRWSKNKNIPHLGHENSTFEEVDRFYRFWYDFESWREFSYLDEEEKEKGECREERRWIDKQNKAARQKLKKEEASRIRQLVDNAYSCDPRISKFKEEEKQRKLAVKRAKQESFLRSRAEERERLRKEAEELERKAKEKELAEAQAREKLEKDEQLRKIALEKEREELRSVGKKWKYFMLKDSEFLEHLTELEKLCELLPVESLQELNQALADCNTTSGRSIFLKAVKKLNEQLSKDREELFNVSRKSSSASKENSAAKQWSSEDVHLLIKAVNLFPAGTNQRWEVIANYINQHSKSEVVRNAKEVISKAKSIQKSGADLKDEVNKQAFHKFEKNQKGAVSEEAAPTERYDTAADMQGLNMAPWTAEEQRLLEQALKTYPNTTENRWDCIAGCIPGRGKKDCIKRYKELVEIVKSKKAAQAGIGHNKK